MRILTVILLILTGGGLIVYSYIGSLFQLAGEVEQTARSGNDVGAFAMIIDFLMRGEIPQLSAFLYGGVFLISVAVVMLIVRRGKEESHDQ